jgi:hypothetical protein
MGLGVTAGVVAKNLSAPVGIPSHIVQGQGGSLQYAGHRGGVQAIDETLAPAYQQVDTRGVKAAVNPALGYDISGFTQGAANAPAAVGPDDRLTTTLPASLGNLRADTVGIIPREAFAPATAANSFLGPDAQERNSQLAASMRSSKAHGYI